MGQKNRSFLILRYKPLGLTNDHALRLVTLYELQLSSLFAWGMPSNSAAVNYHGSRHLPDSVSRRQNYIPHCSVNVTETGALL
jgi:hypothetical protein